MSSNVEVKAVITAEDRASALIAGFGRAIQLTGGNIISTSNSIGSAFGNMIGQLGQDVAQAGRLVLSLAAKVASIAWTTLKVGALVGGAALAGLGIFAIKTASDLQATQISMIGLTHSMDLGTKAMAGAYAYAQKSPFKLPEVAGATKTLIAFGIQANDAVKYLDLLGNVSITSGVDIRHLAGIFGQVSAQGKLMLQDIRQLTQDGVAILPALQKQFGKTAQQVQDMATAGQISFEDFRKAMSSLVDPSILDMLNNTLPRQLDRLQGSLRILGFAFIGASVDATNGFTAAKDGIYQATVNITKLVADELRSPAVMNAAAAMGRSIAVGLDEIPKWITTHQAQIDNFFNRVADFFNHIADVAQKNGVKGAFIQLGEGIKEGIMRIDFKAIAKKLFTSLVDTIAGTDPSTYSEKLTQAILNLFTAVNWGEFTAGAVALIVTSVPSIISGFIKGIIDTATHSPLNFAEFLLAIGFAPAKIVKAFGEVLGKIPFVGPLAEFILRIMKSMADFVLTPIKGLFEALGRNIAGALKTGVRSVLGDVSGVLIDFFSGSGSWLVTAGSMLVRGFVSGITIATLAIGGALIGVFAAVMAVMSGAGWWLIDHGYLLVVGFVRGIQIAVPIIFGYVAGGIFGGLMAFFATSGQWLVQAGINVIRGLYDGILFVASLIWSADLYIFSLITGFFAGAYGWLIGHGQNIIRGLANGISSVAGAVWGAIAAVSGQIGAFFAGAGGWLYGVGQAIIHGLANGIRSVAEAPAHAVREVIDRISRILPHSPAKEGPFSGTGWTPYRGRAIVEGLAKGINSAGSTAVDAARGVVDDVSSALQSPQSSVSSNINGSPLQTSQNTNSVGSTSVTTTPPALNITIQAQAFVGSQIEARRFAQMIMDAYNDAQRARGVVA